MGDSTKDNNVNIRCLLDDAILLLQDTGVKEGIERWYDKHAESY